MRLRVIASLVVLGALALLPYGYEVRAAAEVLAFPGADGYGKNSVGGSGRHIPGAPSTTVIHVTRASNNAAYDDPSPTVPGTLRYALTRTYPRTVVFDVSGTIVLNSTIAMTGPASGADMSYCTIAAHTSPGGIQVKSAKAGQAGAAIHLTILDGCHDVIIRYLRWRPGGFAQWQGDDDNCIVIYGPTQWCYNVMIDHCSLQWGNDEMASNYGKVKLTSWTNNLIAEGVTQAYTKATLGSAYNGAGHAFLIDSYRDLPDLTADTAITVARNMLVDCENRNPSIGEGWVELVNNIAYNWNSNNAFYWGVGMSFNTDDSLNRDYNKSAFIDAIANIWKLGPDSSFDGLAVQNWSGSPYNRTAKLGGTKVYLEQGGTYGNYFPGYPSGRAGTQEQQWDATSPMYNWEWWQTPPYNSSFSVTYSMAGTSTRSTTAMVTNIIPTANLVSVLTATTPDAYGRGAVGASRCSGSDGLGVGCRDTVDQRAITKFNTNSGSLAIADLKCAGPYLCSDANAWPDLATGAPTKATDTDQDGMPDSWETSKGLDPNDGTDHVRLCDNGYTALENYLNQIAGDPVPAWSSFDEPEAPGTWDTISYATGSNTSGISWPHSVSSAANRLALIGCKLYGTSGTMTAATIGGAAASSLITDTYYHSSGIFSKTAPSSGSQTVTTTFSAEVANAVCWCATFSNINQATPLGTAVKTRNWSGYVSASPTATSTADIVIAMASAEGPPAEFTTTDPAMTERIDVGVGNSRAAVYTKPGASGAVSLQSDFASPGAGGQMLAVAVYPNAADTTAPSITITAPTGGTTWSCDTSSLEVSGTASDDVGLQGISWSNAAGGNGSGSGTTSWTAVVINLVAGDNVVTFTATDTSGNTSTDTLTITYTPPQGDSQSGNASHLYLFSRP